MSSWGTPRRSGSGGLLIAAVVAVIAWFLFWAMAMQPPTDDSGTDGDSTNQCAEQHRNFDCDGDG